MKEYLRINKKAYDSSASEFEQKTDIRLGTFKEVTNNFISALSGFDSPKILELGPGAGYIVKILSEQGHDVSAIEFSEKMAEIVKKTAPKVDLIIDEFLEHDFGNRKFSGILAIAFVHLFTNEDVLSIMHKINSLLVEKGIAFISTTYHEKGESGYFRKTNFKGAPLRYRKRFTENELDDLFDKTGFRLLKRYKVVNPKEVKGKVWITNILEKK